MSAINSLFTKGDVVEYHYKDNIFEATIMDVHLENGPNDPYYFISYVKPNGQKIEKQTTKEQVFVLSDDHPSSSVAKEQTQTEDELLQAAIAQSLAEAKIESDKANSRTTNNSTITVAQQEMNERMAAMAVASDRQTKKKQEEEEAENAGFEILSSSEEEEEENSDSDSYIMESGSEESYTYEDSDEDIAADIANIDELTESELQKIIEKSTDVNDQSQFDRSYLSVAIERKFVITVRMLLGGKHGGGEKLDIHAVDKGGETADMDPFTLAVLNGNLDIISMFYSGEYGEANRVDKINFSKIYTLSHTAA